jgi:tetratricopeptide (TPR) repeat protein
LGRSNEALRAAEAAIKAARRAPDPIGESVALLQLGDIRRSQGDVARALEAYDETCKIKERLVETMPFDDDLKMGLGVAYERIGDIRMSQGRSQDAFHAYTRRHTLLTSIADRQQGNAHWQSELSLSLERLGKFHRARHDNITALAAYENSLRIRAGLHRADPTNGRWSDLFLIGLQQVGDIRFDLGDLEGAEEAYETAISKLNQLTQSNAANLEWQRFQSIALERIGNVQRAKGDIAAVKSYEQALAVSENIAAMDPGNAVWQRDLIGAHKNLAEIANSKSTAQKHYEQALRIARELYKSGRLEPEYHFMIPELLARLAALEIRAKSERPRRRKEK